MPAGQVCVTTRLGHEQRRILRENAARTVAAADPQLVLAFLMPPQRAGLAAHLEPQVVLVPGAHLADRHTALRAVRKPKQHRRQILAAHINRFTLSVRHTPGHDRAQIG